MCDPETSTRADHVVAAAEQIALGRLVAAQISEHADTILESLPDALLIVDRDGRIALANRQAEKHAPPWRTSGGCN